MSMSDQEIPLPPPDPGLDKNDLTQPIDTNIFQAVDNIQSILHSDSQTPLTIEDISAGLIQAAVEEGNDDNDFIEQGNTVRHLIETREIFDPDLEYTNPNPQSVEAWITVLNKLLTAGVSSEKINKLTDRYARNRRASKFQIKRD